MPFTHVGAMVYQTAPSTPPTTAPGSVVTIDGGPQATANIAGPANDPADFYGIILVLAGIALAIFATRKLFGDGDRSRRSRAVSGPTPTEPAEPRPGGPGAAGPSRS